MFDENSTERSDQTLYSALDFAKIKPQVLQAEAHPYFSQTHAKEILQLYGTRLMAWYPLCSGDRACKSNVQIILRGTQMGHIVIPGSTTPKHIHANHDIFDFKLTDVEMHLDGPYDGLRDFIAQQTEPVILYGRESEIAPLLGLVKFFSGQRQLHLIWSQGKVAGDYYDQSLQNLQAAGVKIDRRMHRFSVEDLQKLLSAVEVKHGAFVVVGSSGKVLLVEQKLEKIGVNDQQIFDERLTM